MAGRSGPSEGHARRATPELAPSSVCVRGRQCRRGGSGCDLVCHDGLRRSHPKPVPVAALGQPIDTGRWTITFHDARIGSIPPTGIKPSTPKKLVMVEFDLDNRSASTSNVSSACSPSSRRSPTSAPPTFYLARDKWIASGLHPDMPERMIAAWEWPSAVPCHSNCASRSPARSTSAGTISTARQDGSIASRWPSSRSPSEAAHERFLKGLLGVALAAAVLYGMQRTTPGYGEITSPVPSRASSAKVASKRAHSPSTSPRCSSRERCDQRRGRDGSFTRSGVWVLVEGAAEALVKA